MNSLKMLSALLYQHHKQKAVLLDEYDVPLDKTFHYGSYCEMVSLIHSLFGQALKTKDFL